jgi:hypothetical protein
VIFRHIPHVMFRHSGFSQRPCPWAIPQNTTQKSISIVFSVSSIRHDSSLSKYRKQKQSPPGNTKNGARPGGWLLLFAVLAEWRIMTNSAYAKNNGDGLLCSILWQYGKILPRQQPIKLRDSSKQMLAI